MVIGSVSASSSVGAETSIAGLGDRVGPKAEVATGLHQLVDDCGVGHGIDVVDDQRTLVSDPAMMCELDWAFHRLEL